jgi:hypothetical protein
VKLVQSLASSIKNIHEANFTPKRYILVWKSATSCPLVKHFKVIWRWSRTRFDHTLYLFCFETLWNRVVGIWVGLHQASGWASARDGGGESAGEEVWKLARLHSFHPWNNCHGICSQVGGCSAKGKQGFR